MWTGLRVGSLQGCLSLHACIHYLSNLSIFWQFFHLGATWGKCLGQGHSDDSVWGLNLQALIFSSPDHKELDTKLLMNGKRMNIFQRFDATVFTLYLVSKTLTNSKQRLALIPGCCIKLVNQTGTVDFSQRWLFLCAICIRGSVNEVWVVCGCAFGGWDRRTGASPAGFCGPTKCSTFCTQAVKLVMAFESNRAWACWINMRVTVTSDLRASIKRSAW